MVVVPRYSHHSHTGRLTHHSNTSYALLAFLLLCVGVLLMSFTWATFAATTGEGQYTVNAVVIGPRPTQPVIITSPTNGQSFNANPVEVQGTCPNKALIKIFSNGVLVGSIMCGPTGRFTLPISLLIGQNLLTALPYNAVDQEGPSSPGVTVTLNMPPGGIGFSNELVIQSINYYRGSEPGQEVVWPIDLVGGQAPYAVSIDWGDGTSDVITRLAPGPFTMSHIYKKVGGYLGTYPLIIRASDSVGHTAYLQLTTIVNAAEPGGTAAKKESTNSLMMIWPLWIVLFLMILSFWLGERREKKIMERRFEAAA